MTLSSAILEDRRSRANYLPMCPLCSLQVGTKAQILTGPSLRSVPFSPSRDFPEGRTVVKLDGCCKYSTPPENYFDSEASAASWWRSARLMEVGSMATENRRRRTLARLAEANLEPIE